MKKNPLYRMTAWAVATLMFASCDDAKNGVIDNMLYLHDASTATSKDIVLPDNVGETVNTTLTVRLAKATTSDITVDLTVDSSLLDEYNESHETGYLLPETSNYTYPSKVTIPAGSVSVDLDIVISKFEGIAGAEYAIPFKLVNAKGIELTRKTSEIVMTLSSPLIQEVPCFQWYNGMSAGGDWGIEVNNYTVEWWCKMSGFSVNNQAIMNIAGTKECYIRMGDVLYAVNGSYVYNWLQIKHMGAQFDTGSPADGNGLNVGEWYHFAMTYDGSTGTSLLYKNGQQVASLVTDAGVSQTINGIALISSGQTYFRDKCEICQVRIWKTTRTATQLQKYMYKEVPYTDSNLVLYYPMNETEGTTIHDVTGNGRNIEVGSSNPTNTNAQTFTRSTYKFSAQ
jgi:hypothetical protein